MLDFAMFAAAVVITAFAIIGGLYLLFRHTRPQHNQKPKRFMTSNLK
jgi:hypothetical protein